MELTFGGARVAVGGSLLRPDFSEPPAGSADVVIGNKTVLAGDAARIGVNADYWTDAMSRRAPGAVSQRFGYADLGAKYVRWPGGHKADGVTYFLDENGNTLTEPVARLCRFGAGEWPATDPTYWTPTNQRTGRFSRDLYSLRDFLEDTRAAGAEPVIVVALDTAYNPPSGAGAWGITKAQAIANAVEMVRWCNVTHDYGVRYWELGNESWSNSTGYTRGFVDPDGTVRPDVYGAWFAEMAAAMKAVDPSILVGLNGNQQAFFETALAAAGPQNVDFLAAHRYPFFGTDYAAYQAISAPNMLSEANRATNAIAGLAEPHRSRIFTMMTETGFNSQPNNLGAAVIMAHILGAQIAAANVVSTMVWNTRYPPGGASHDVLDDYNRLKPSGMGVAMAAKLAPGKVVAATSSVTGVVAYASRDVGLGRTAVMLINRDSDAHTVTVGVSGVSKGQRWQLAGTGAADAAPTINRTAVTVTGGVLSVPLPGVSVTVLDLVY